MSKEHTGFSTRGRSSPVDISIVCIPFQVDVARWGCARGPQALLDVGIGEQIRARGHNIRDIVWVDLPKSERTRDSVTNLGRIAHRAANAVKAALAERNRFVLVLAGE